MFFKVQGSRCRNMYWDLDVCSLDSGQFGGKKSFGHLEKPLEIVDNVFCPHKK
jgi:hypothetical protein